MAWTSDGVTDNQYIKWRLSWSESDKNEANNTSKVTVKLYVRRTNTGYSTSGSGTAYIWIDGTKYSGSITNSTTITSTEKCILTKSKTITHNSDGSKSISIAGDISHSRFDATKKSWSITLSTIPRASSISSISGNTIGSSITVNISRKSSAFKHTVEFYIGSTKISTWSSVATKQTFTPDLNTCCSKITSATSATAKINVTTYNGSTKIGSTASKSFTIYVPSSAVPRISAFTLTPSNSNSLLASSGLYVQGYTKYTAAITAAGIYGSTIKSYATSGGGASTASASATSGVISQSGTINITATATDTRGRTVTQTKSITVLSYAKPTITTNIYRCDANGYENSGGDNVYINILSKNATSLNGLNSVNSVKVQYKKTTETAWSSAVTISGTTTILKNLSSDSAYNLKFTITDKIGSTNTLDTTVNSEKVILDIFKGGTGVAIGKVADTANLFDVALRTVFRTGTNSAVATANSGYVLIGNPASQHISIDNNEIMSKANGTAGGDLHLQAEGGNLYLGTNMVQVGYNRFSNGVLGFYHNSTDAMNNTNRVGYIGPPDASNIDIHIKNEAGGWTYVTSTFRCLESIRTASRLYLEAPKSTSTGVICYWKDGVLHDIIARASDGLTLYLGPGSISSSYKTVTNLRGYTVRLYNHGGGTYLGTSGSTAVTSDRNLKRDIYDINDQYVEFFMRLRPVSYKYNAKENVGHRDHIGYIAQEVEDALLDSGLTTEQFGGICIETDVDFNMDYDSEMTEEELAAGNIHYDKLYSLRYEEFIALNTHMIQKALNLIDAQQAKIDELETRIAKLEKILERHVSE